ncbi:hypothetical protein QJS04_geneDACA016428 [Acorus gramineus]|uniref:Uncharacterized protein n=1 Tax=Acorus gramineus TaxID=55184 RepID=A0AAV9B9Q3_ACOGR|nr:hypothetical protein QJS04_geneDACA016428 [Acorus gramineus]
MRKTCRRIDSSSSIEIGSTLHKEKHLPFIGYYQYPKNVMVEIWLLLTNHYIHECIG